MSAPKIVPDIVKDKQCEVANPAVSAWVAANAGSGKTHVLAQRVINLLLENVEPEKILCITFTKAAAANMARRVFDTLGAWTTLDDTDLDQAIHEQSGRRPDARRRTLARQLFARALETPGGLKVQTIHAFCTQLLHRFPFEANVAARFNVLDDTTQAHLLEELTLAVLLDGAAAPESPLGRALVTAMIAAADQTFRDVVRGAIAKRDAIGRWVEKARGVEGAIAELSRALGLDPSDSMETVSAQYFNASPIAASEWPAIARILAQGGKTDGAQADRFASLASQPENRRRATYVEIFCTGQGAPRKSIVTKAIRDENPDLAERLTAEQQRVCALLERGRAIACRDRSAALVTVANEVLTRYVAEKNYRGLADYDDLIDRTLDLLNNVDAAWVHYKLDFGIDHLLIDEAQDTSRKQWDIVRKLVEEFTAGAGAHEGVRTIFAVGDEKQSIYSFQNAAPREFVAEGVAFERAHRGGAVKFIHGRLEHSFRSGESVLSAVDIVFKNIAASVTSDKDGFPAHLALPDAAPGVVEIWEPTTPDDRTPVEAWDAPFDTVSETSPRVKLARRIAHMVRKLVADGEPVGNDRRAARYGDVLVLVRQRGELFEAIIRALKQEGVQVAGADRLVLTEHIAVMDLMALADAILLPEDDLALATVLRSPLFGFEDADLFEIAWDRGRATLREALARKSGEREIFTAAGALLDKLTQDARHLTPFMFYAEILGAGGARRRFLARLGPEANDALDEFLNLALDHERRETPSLQGFVAWLREANAEVKRDMEIVRNEVRVMTVHGAKGLEAPIVILADTMTRPAGPRPPQLLALAAGPMIWPGKKEDDSPTVTAARQSAEDEQTHEYRRLLYVAMTRAADCLIICGAVGRTKRPDGCWYNLVSDALKPLLVEEEGVDGKVWRYRKVPARPTEPSPRPASDAEEIVAHAMPAWLRQPAPSAAPRAVALTPSSVLDEDTGGALPTAASAREREKALQRGRVVHRLMQSLPDIAPAHRKAALERYLANAAADFSAAEQAEIARQIFAVLDEPHFAEMLAPGGRAEVPVVGRIMGTDGKLVGVSGQVDRLIITQDAVLIADYKTDRIVPGQVEDAPRHYIGQLALYRAVLMKLYPEKTVRAALIFTSGPSLLEIPVATMESAIGELLTKACHVEAKVP